jgi:16S rRNA (uracil1498-N3)-methyltransferase
MILGYHARSLASGVGWVRTSFFPHAVTVMSERFFLAAPPRDGRAVLDGDEARHLARVLRARAGDTVTVFAGGGVEWPARVAAIGRDEVAVEVGPPRHDPPAAGPPLTLAVALPKGERQKWLVEKLTELGVARFVPLVTERGVAEATPATAARLARTVIEACKQCGRNTLLEIGPPAEPTAFLQGLPPGAVAILADPLGAALDEAVAAGAPAVAVLVGPEGGFTDGEIAAATAAGCRRVSLGRHVLRVETAAIALAARFAG